VPLRTIAVDFNSYFASCEQQEQPRLRGRPVAVVPVRADTTCCISVSHAAKVRGVKAEMGVGEAKLRCPDLELVEARPRLYVDYHRRLLEVIEGCVHVTNIKSVDEVECDLTAAFAPREKALALAHRIKARIAAEVGPCLTCSIGLAPNWLLAKLATDLRKPDGLVVLDEPDLPGRLLHLELQDFLGIGGRMEARLRAHGIDTVARLYAATKAELRGVWGGVEGERMWARLRGEPVPFLTENHQSVGHSHVLPPKLRTPALARAVLHRLLQKAALRLRAIGHYAAGLQVFVAHREGPRWSDEIRFNDTDDTLALTHAFIRLWARQPAGLRHATPFQVGLVLTPLVAAGGHTPDLFEPAREAAHGRLDRAVDQLNQTYGHGSVYYGGAWGVTDNAPMRISFTRIPAPELEEIDHARGRRVRPLAPPPVPAPDFGDN
jgi:DNA polymerase IV